MRSPATVPAPAAEDLAAVVRAGAGATGEVVSIERRPNGFSTKAATELVRLELAGGDAFELFVKRVAAAPGARRPDPPDTERRVYDALGRHPAFAAPRCFGVTAGRDPWLVLEAVPGWDLRYRDLDDWEAAARALARMQSAFHSDLDVLAFLRERDAASFAAAAHDALSMVERTGATGAALRPVVGDYERIARELADLPRTLVHGDLAPKNALVAAGEARFVDWEWAHVGPGVTDLADLVNGLDDAATGRLVDAYVEAARGSALPDADEGVVRALDLARLERLVFRIGRSAAWGVDAGVVRAWVDEAASLHARL